MSMRLVIFWIIVIFCELVGLPIIAMEYERTYSKPLLYVIIAWIILVMITAILVILTIKEDKEK